MTIKILFRKVWGRMCAYFNKLLNFITPASRQEKDKITTIKNKFPYVLDTTNTLKRIIDFRLSICRYGDAEFDTLNTLNENDSYQKSSERLTERLTEILKYPSDSKVLICIPPFNSSTNNIKCYYKRLSFWESYWLKRFDRLSPLFIQKEYGNSFVSRDTVFYENGIKNIKKIWEHRKVVFVYGKGGRFQTDSILFDNITGFETVLVPPINAFEEYDFILLQCSAFPKDRLFIIAAGPTATVLAFDLAQKGYQALDMGHLPNCYEQYLGKMPAPENTPLIKNRPYEN